jgi:hypothetical protein
MVNCKAKTHGSFGWKANSLKPERSCKSPNLMKCSDSYAEAMLVAYNRKCKYTLRMTKLHSGKVAAEDDFVEENEEPLADDPVLEE